MTHKKTTTKEPDKSRSLKRAVKHHRLVVFLITILLLLFANFLYGKYLDWDNAQMIKGLSKDFPALVSEIEKVTGLDLEIKSNCMTTQEKFDGVSNCEMKVGSIASFDQMQKASKLMNDSEKFPKFKNYDNNEGIEASYRNKRSCNFRTVERIYISCLTGVREANIELAKELF